ncbi:hypothetical protein PPERSA_03028 [Pseudocohnilembus persalinus]|uniref:Uncharacterized protein n=1 Tax=Pseudocohnilembus persalinus TaxID=266149 RepID=A0A0V0QF78_PSEPJ|nr:hypothetical protein PPERSA_03028 [Pseudocohnilembus persalinus]|eukprot:KRX00768.1 hypothetical protein PPERSA_03028 [Pseudocohnilembus persalinus]
MNQSKVKKSKKKKKILKETKILSMFKNNQVNKKDQEKLKQFKIIQEQIIKEVKQKESQENEFKKKQEKLLDKPKKLLGLIQEREKISNQKNKHYQNMVIQYFQLGEICQKVQLINESQFKILINQFKSYGIQESDMNKAQNKQQLNNCLEGKLIQNQQQISHFCQQIIQKLKYNYIWWEDKLVYKKDLENISFLLEKQDQFNEFNNYYLNWVEQNFIGYESLLNQNQFNLQHEQKNIKFNIQSSNIIGQQFIVEQLDNLIKENDSLNQSELMEQKQQQIRSQHNKKIFDNFNILKTIVSLNEFEDDDSDFEDLIAQQKQSQIFFNQTSQNSENNINESQIDEFKISHTQFKENITESSNLFESIQLQQERQLTQLQTKIPSQNLQLISQKIINQSNFIDKHQNLLHLSLSSQKVSEQTLKINQYQNQISSQTNDSFFSQPIRESSLSQQSNESTNASFKTKSSQKISKNKIIDMNQTQQHNV